MTKRTHSSLTDIANDNGCIYDDFDGCGSLFFFACEADAADFHGMLRRCAVECAAPYLWQADTVDLDLDDSSALGSATTMVFAVECASTAG